MVSVRPSSCGCTWEVAKHERRVRVARGDYGVRLKLLEFYNIDIILSNFSFSKPIESLQTCISMASLRSIDVTPAVTCSTKPTLSDSTKSMV